MTLIQYFSISVLVAIAIFIGAYVAKNSDEELKVGSKHIRVLTLILAYVILFLTVSKISSNIILSSFIPTIIIALILLVPKNVRSYAMIAIVAAAISFMLKKDVNYVVSSIVFIQMLCIGAMTYYLEKRELLRSLLVKAAILLAILAIAYFV